MTAAHRPAPISFSPSTKHKRLMDEALQLAGITKRQKFWFPRLMTELLKTYKLHMDLLNQYLPLVSSAQRAGLDLAEIMQKLQSGYELTKKEG